MKNKLKSVLNKFGFSIILPKEKVRDIIIEDNNEKLIKIDEILRAFDQDYYIRKSVYDKLLKVNQTLKEDNLQLKIFDAYRSLDRQIKSWNARYNEVKNANPALEETEIRRLTRICVAEPTPGRFGGHQTGGAIDITLCDLNGNELDMGNKYDCFDKTTKTKNKYISNSAKKNRNRLLKIMKKEDFINYPGEWWHFCYGDSMWAAYKGRKQAKYGYIEIENTK